MKFDISCCLVPNDLWERLRTSIAEDKFWAFQARASADEPDTRLRIAVENLPLPGAFREAAVALRRIISHKRKSGAPYDEELQFLYSLAATSSFASETAYIEELAEPSWNAIEMMELGDWESHL